MKNSLLVALGFFLSFFVSNLHAQGDDNPAGSLGEFNGNVSTAGSYDPYTGNAKRVVTDISVPGAVGAYPLAFTRIANTRGVDATLYNPFGKAGVWRHSYQWEIRNQSMDWDVNCDPIIPTNFTVVYPDGREVTLHPEAGHPGYYNSTVNGIADRLYSNFDAALKKIVQTQGGKTPEQANEYLEQLKRDKRYKRDVY